MAKPVSVEQRPCTAIVWKIVDPISKGNYYSEDFNLQDSRWKFKFIHNTYPEIQIQFLAKIDPMKSFLAFSATSYIEGPGRLPKSCQKVEVDERNCGSKTVWSVTGGLTKEDEKLLTGVVTFVFLCAAPCSVPSDRENKYVQTLPHMDPVPCLESLSFDFSKLLTSRSKPDVMLKCGDRTTPAHRLVLSARSEVFAAMFSNDMQESRTGTVDIVDLDQDVLDQLLQYLYSGKVPNLTVDTAQCLYSAGDKYAVYGLKNKCKEFLLDNLNKENVYSCLVFANIHSDSKLKGASTSIFVNNLALLKNDSWFKICDEQPKLANEVYQAFCQKLPN